LLATTTHKSTKPSTNCSAKHFQEMVTSSSRISNKLLRSKDIVSNPRKTQQIAVSIKR
jgi:hypothetical protein